MSTERKLAWAALLLTLPGLVPIFKDEHYKIGALIVIVFVALAAMILYLDRFTRRPAITITHVRKTLTIHDIAGVSATLDREQTFVPNYPNTQEIWFRNIVSDGSVSNLQIDGSAPTGQTTLGCLISVVKRYAGPLQRGRPQDVRFSFDLGNSFPARDEAIIHDTEPDTKRLTLAVHLPPARRCIKAALHVSAAGSPLFPMEDLARISPDRTMITAEIQHPRAGHSYQLDWEW